MTTSLQAINFYFISFYGTVLFPKPLFSTGFFVIFLILSVLLNGVSNFGEYGYLDAFILPFFGTVLGETTAWVFILLTKFPSPIYFSRRARNQPPNRLGALLLSVSVIAAFAVLHVAYELWPLPHFFWGAFFLSLLAPLVGLLVYVFTQTLCIPWIPTKRIVHNNNPTTCTFTTTTTTTLPVPRFLVKLGFLQLILVACVWLGTIMSPIAVIVAATVCGTVYSFLVAEIYK